MSVSRWVQSLFFSFLLLAFLTSVEASMQWPGASCKRGWSFRVCGVQTGPACNAEGRTTVFRMGGAGEEKWRSLGRQQQQRDAGEVVPAADGLACLACPVGAGY